MKWGQGKSFPIQLLVNFWELEAEALEGLLKVLSSEKEIPELCAFVPWSVVESDPQQRLSKFLAKVLEGRFGLTLIPTLELGICAPWSGLPTDVVGRDREGSDRSARDGQGAWIGAYAPPNMFAVPSPHHSELEKRYQGFLGRLQRDLSAWMRAMPGLDARVRIAFGGGLHAWVGDRDRSPSAALAFRRYVDDLCDRAEYREDPRWRRSDRERAHRPGFVRLETELHRLRAARILLRGLEGVARAQWNLVAPELDPSMDSLWAGFALGEDQGWARRVVEVLAERALEVQTVAGEPTSNFVHWISGGPTAMLGEADRQQLILRSLIACGGAPEGGGVLMDAQEWLRLSPRFRLHATSLARMLHRGECEDFVRVDAVGAPSAFQGFLRSGVRYLGSLDGIENRGGSRLVWVGKSTVLDEGGAESLIRLARGGKTVALSTETPLTDRAERVLSRHLEPEPQLDLHLGARVKLHQFTRGRFLLVHPAEDEATRRVVLQSVLSLCDLQETLAVEGIEPIVLDRSRLDAGGTAVFLLNPSDEPCPAVLRWTRGARVRDLFQKDGVVQTEDLEMEVPAKGVISLAVQETREETQHALRLEEPARGPRGEDVGTEFHPPRRESPALAPQ